MTAQVILARQSCDRGRLIIYLLIDKYANGHDHFLLDYYESVVHTPGMPKRSSTNKGQKQDVNKLAKSMVDLVTGNPITEEPLSTNAKNPAAVALGRLGGLKGGKARAEALSTKKRVEIAKKAAQARWSKGTSS